MEDLMKTTQLLIESELRNEELKISNEQLDSALCIAYDDIEKLGAQLALELQTLRSYLMKSLSYKQIYNAVEMHIDKEIDKDELIETLKNTLGL